MAEASPTPKKSIPRKVAAPARTGRRTGARTAAAPAAEVEETAVRTALPRPSPTRAAARAAAALRGEPEAGPVAGPASPEPPEPAAEEEPQEELTALVPFMDGTVEVRLPSEEQLVMYRRLSRDFQDLTQDGRADKLSTDQALRELDRAVRLVQSVLVTQRDKERIEDGLLEGKIKLRDCTDLLKQAFILLNKKHEEQAAAGANRATRRASRARLED